MKSTDISCRVEHETEQLSKSGLGNRNTCTEIERHEIMSQEMDGWE